MLNCPSPVGEVEVMKADCPFYKLLMLFYARILPGALDKNVKSEKNRQEKKITSSPNKYQEQFVYFFLYFFPCGWFPSPLCSSIAVGTRTPRILQDLNGAEGRATTLVK